MATNAGKLLVQLRSQFAQRRYPEMLQTFQQMVQTNKPPPKHITWLALEVAAEIEPAVVQTYVKWAEEAIRTRPPGTSRRAQQRQTVVLDAQCYSHLLWSLATTGDAPQVQAVYQDMKTAEMPLVGRAAAAVLSTASTPADVLVLYRELQAIGAEFDDEAWDTVGGALEHAEDAEAQAVLNDMKQQGAHFHWALYA